jgi:hypothetical protein
MRTLSIVGILVTFMTSIGCATVRADESVECRNMWEAQKADVDGPVLTVADLGAGRGDQGRYRIVVRDRFSGCRVGDNTNTVCRVGQHASIVGGSFGLWSGDEKNADSDYPYVGKHVWTCE